MHGAAAEPLRFQPLDHACDRGRRTHPVERAAVHHDALVRHRLGHRVGVDRIRALGLDHHAHRQVVRAGEREVPLVVRRHRHDGAGPVLHEDVGRGVTGHPLPVHRVHRVHAEERSLLRVRLLPGHERGRALALQERSYAVPGPAQLGEPPHRRVLEREHEERDAPQRVRAGREDGDPIARLGDLELDLRTPAPPDPVALHRDDTLRPVHQLVHVVQERVGVVGDLEEPLGEVAALDGRAAPLAGPRDHLLVREDRLVLRAPVDRRLPAVGQTAIEQLKEEPLRPAVVLRVARREAPAPVERHPHPLERRRLLLDVGVGPLLRVDAASDRRVLRGEPERVPADGMQDVVPLHRPETGYGIPAAEGFGVAHMEVTRWVGEHVEGVEARASVIGIVRGRVQAFSFPDPLPSGLDLRGVVAAAHGQQMVANSSLRPLKSIPRTADARVEGT